MSSLIEINGNLLNPLSDVAIALLDKIEKATGWLFSTTTAKKQGYKNIIEDISKREDLNPIDRVAIISEIKKIKKQHINKSNIIEKAIDLLDEKTSIENIDKLDDDWLLKFFESCKNTSNEKIQFVWAKILAGECNGEPNKSFKLFSTISDMTVDIINLIMKFAEECNYSSSPFESIGIVCQGHEYLKSININYEEIIELEDLGIIKRELICLPNEFTYDLEDRKIKFSIKKGSSRINKVCRFL